MSDTDNLTSVPPEVEQFLAEKPAETAAPKAMDAAAPEEHAPPAGDVPPEVDQILSGPTEAEQYGSIGQQALAGAEGVAKGVLGPIAPLLETKTGLTSEEAIRGRENQHPITSGLGELAGFGASMATGVGEGALIAKAGNAIEHALPATSLAAKVGTAAARSAVEGLLLGGSDEVSKAILHDPSQTAQSAIQHIGLSGLIGAGIGGTLSGGAELLTKAAGAESKLGKLAADFKSRIKEHVDNPDPVHGITNELNDYYQEVNKLGSEVYGDTGLKAEALGQLMPEMHEGIAEQVGGIIKKLEKTASKLVEENDPNARYIVDKLNKLKEAGGLESGELEGESSQLRSGKVFNALQDLKKSLQADSKYTEGVSPLAERAYRSAAKSLAYDVREALEDSNVWGPAGELQRDINGAFTDYLKATKDFRGLMTTEEMGQRVVDPKKVQTYLNQLGKPSAEIKMEKLQNFIEHGDRFKQAVSDAYEKAGLGESPLKETSLNMTKRTFDEKTAGEKLADAFIEKGLTETGNRAMGAAVGLGAAHSLGISREMGALLGNFVLGPLFKSVLPGIAKAIVGAEANGAGLKAAATYAASAAKGASAVESGIKKVFKEGATEAMATPNVSKLDKLIKGMQATPDKLMEMTKGLQHYMPEHATAAALTAGGAIAYLQSLSPDQSGNLLPLDNKPIPNPAAEARYKSALHIAEQPTIVLDKIKQGTLTHNDIKDLQTMYPSLYTQMVTKMNDAILDAKTKDKEIPYKTKVGLSMFLAQPMDSTMTPMAIMAMQSGSLASKPMAGGLGGPIPGQGKVKSQGVKSSPALQKMSSLYITPSQARLQRRGK